MWSTIGHEWAVQQLARSVSSGRLARANLFAGPARIGKTHLALAYAKALNCTGAETPCGQCENCQMAGATHPDVLVIEAQGGHVKIDQVRALQYDISLKPYQGRWRVAIITGMETATEEAENALLKTLEEPPAQAVIILTALDAGLLTPTVVSRCRVLSLQPVASSIIAQALVERGLAEQARAEEIARLSAGRVGWALEAAKDTSLIERREQLAESLMELMHKGHAARVSAAETYARQGELRQVLSEWQSVWRDVMLISAGCGDLIGNYRQRDRLQRIADTVGLARAQRAAVDAQTAMQHLEQNVNPRLAVETMLLGWCYLD